MVGRIQAHGSAWLRGPFGLIQSHRHLCSRAGTEYGFRQGNFDPEVKLLPGLADVRNVAVAAGAGVGPAQDVQRFVWRQDDAH